MEVPEKVLTDIKKIVFSNHEPRPPYNIMWAKKNNNNVFDYYVFNDGEWHKVSIGEDVPEVSAYLSAFINDVGFITEEGVEGKQDVIVDLDTIRQGAALGGTSYQKPNTGIPKADLASSVQVSLSKADTALQDFTETDPTVPAWAKESSKPAYTAQEVGALPANTPLFSGNYNDLSNKPTNISAFTNDAGYLVEQDIYDDLAAVAISGDYADLKNTPDIPDISRCIKKSSTAGLVKNNGTIDTNTYLTQHQDISGKYDKTGGTISGDVKVEGTFTIDIDDEDYDAGITASGELNDNLGTILTLQGYAGSTQYKALVRNIATPNSNYDAANKKYVDDNVVVPTYHLVELNTDWSVKTKASTLTYATVSSNLTDPKEADYLDIIKETSTGSNVFIRFHAPCVGIDEVNSGNIIFCTNIFINNNQLSVSFMLDTQSTLSTVAVVQTPESAVNKVNSIVNYSTSTLNYPSTKAVYDEYQRKPVIVWQHQSGGTLIKALNVNIAASLNWQITGLDLTQYKRLKFYVTGGTSSNNISPHVVLEMSLDDGATTSDTYNHYTASGIYQYLNNDNRLYIVTMCVKSDKTSVCFLRQTSLYGTAGTSAVDDTRYLYKIEGYFD